MRPDRIVCTAREAKAIDRLTQTEDGLSGSHLMVAAGVAMAMLIRQRVPSGTPVLVVEGPGNNGGDGRVIGRILAEIGYPVTRQPWLTNVEWPDRGIIVDALFGIGLSRDLDPPICALIDAMNATGRDIWSVDVPSGLDATNGLVRGAVVKARHTVAMGCHKSGYFSGAGMQVCGEIHLVPLGFPASELRKSDVDVWFPEDLPVPERRSGAHKYESGVVHVIGGSAGMSGALSMAAGAAWRAGCGAVFAHVPGGLLPAVDAALVQPVKVGHGSAHDPYFSLAHLESVRRHIATKPGVVLIGPGLGRAPESQAFAEALISEIGGTLVVDADALAALPTSRLTQGILTPHPGELAKICGRRVDLWTDRLDAARALATDSGCIVVSKGQPTAAVTPDGRARITGYDTSRFSRMGFGDVLAGTISAHASLNGYGPEAVLTALRSGYDASITTNEPFLPA